MSMTRGADLDAAGPRRRSPPAAGTARRAGGRSGGRARRRRRCRSPRPPRRARWSARARRARCASASPAAACQWPKERKPMRFTHPTIRGPCGAVVRQTRSPSMSPTALKPSRAGTAPLAVFAGSCRISTRSIPSTAKAAGRQEARRRGHDAPADEAGPQPVADLQRVRPATPGQPAAARHHAVAHDSEHDVAAALPVALPSLDEVTTLPDGHRLVGDPRHPRAQVLDAVHDGLVQELCVLHPPAAEQRRHPRCAPAASPSE